MSSSAWFGVGAPRNTPADIVEKLNKEINAGLADPRIKARLADLGGTVLAGAAGTNEERNQESEWTPKSSLSVPAQSGSRSRSISACAASAAR